MALLLNIDTAVETASVCLAKDQTILSFAKNEKQKDQAAWLHVAIKELFEKTDLQIESADAVAVTEGPGSYTGLRIGMATAKGICYALNKPLITLNTLLVMTKAAIDSETELLCPMIDARRMDVFTAVYTKDLETKMNPSAVTLNEESFADQLANHTICFFGNGSTKFQKMKKHANSFFKEINFDARTMVPLSSEKFLKSEFADLAYAEPFYLKEFYTPGR